MSKKVEVIAPSKEAFEDWRNSPVGEWFFSFCGETAAQCKENWTAASWNNGETDPKLLATLQGTARAFGQIQAATFESIMGLDPIVDGRDDVE